MKNEKKDEKESIIILETGIDNDKLTQVFAPCCFSAFMPLTLGGIEAV